MLLPFAPVNVRHSNMMVLVPQAPSPAHADEIRQFADTPGHIMGQVYPNLPVDLESLVQQNDHNDSFLLPRLLVCYQVTQFLLHVRSTAHVFLDLKPGNIFFGALHMFAPKLRTGRFPSRPKKIRLTINYQLLQVHLAI
jgi:hypothetical protein